MLKQAKPGPGSNPLSRLLGPLPNEPAAKEQGHPDEGAASSESAPTVSTAVVESATQGPAHEPTTSESVEESSDNQTPPERLYVKGTFYLLERHDLILEETRISLRRKGNRRVDKSALVREAIELLAAKYHTSE